MKRSVIIPLALVLCMCQEGWAATGPKSVIEPLELYETLTPAEKTVLGQNGFFARKSQFPKFSALYKYLKDKSLPIYITTDCVLHTYHILYDYSLRMLEMHHLYAEVNQLTEKMIEGTDALMKREKGDIKAALLDNLAYFEIAAKLLNPDIAVSKSVEDRVLGELELISRAERIADSPLFGYEEDYSQYRPRGHYTRNDTLKRYFKAMMWYGRMTFRLRPSSDPDNKKGREETVRALLILEVAKDYLEEWKRINSPIILYVGKSDDLTLLEYFEIKDRVFPGDTPLAIARDHEKLARFIDEAMQYRPPRIVSSVVPDTVKPEVATKGLRFFGQKFIPDSYMFQNLVYPKVGTRLDPRLFPRGLDVLAVLGSKRAQEILIQVYRENRFANYESQLKKLIEEFERYTEDDWYFNLYSGWLYTLKSLLLPIPGFQSAYQDKCLQTVLGSWAELRHDTILYAKQSYTAEVTSVRPRPHIVEGYVEPIPECFARLKRLVDISRTELEEKAFLDIIVKQKFEQFSNILGELHRISQQELEQKPLTEKDYLFIQHIGEALDNVERFPAERYTTETDKSAALIADVHTDPNTKKILEVGNDVPALFYVRVQIDGVPRLFVGGVYDYYEFLQPLSARLTDEEWQRVELKPEKPEWIQFFAE